MYSTSSVGRVGIPSGSTEMAVGGLSPPIRRSGPESVGESYGAHSLVVSPPSNPTAPLSTSTPPCSTTGTGVPSTRGRPSEFGMPLTGTRLANASVGCNAPLRIAHVCSPNVPDHGQRLYRGPGHDHGVVEHLTGTVLACGGTIFPQGCKQHHKIIPPQECLARSIIVPLCRLGPYFSAAHHL